MTIIINRFVTGALIGFATMSIVVLFVAIENIPVAQVKIYEIQVYQCESTDIIIGTFRRSYYSASNDLEFFGKYPPTYDVGDNVDVSLREFISRYFQGLSTRCGHITEFTASYPMSSIDAFMNEKSDFRMDFIMSLFFILFIAVFYAAEQSARTQKDQCTSSP